MTVRWTVRAANDRSRDRAARVKSHLQLQKIKFFFGRTLFLSNPKDWYVIRLPCKRYVIKPIGLYIRIDYIQWQAVDIIM